MTAIEEIQIRMQAQTLVPAPELLAAIKKAVLHYSTDPTAIYFYIDCNGQRVGVFGDGENGCYEWFIWRDSVLIHSDAAYGMPEAALRDVLIEQLG
jgi:hypothetical protein